MIISDLSSCVGIVYFLAIDLVSKSRVFAGEITAIILVRFAFDNKTTKE
jgi:hypothetical protein